MGTSIVKSWVCTSSPPQLPEEIKQLQENSLPKDLSFCFNVQPPPDVIPWQDYVTEILPGPELRPIVISALKQQAIKFGLTHHHSAVNDTLINLEDKDRIISVFHNELINVGGLLLFVGETNTCHIYTWNDTILYVSYYFDKKETSVWFTFDTNNPQRYKELLNIKNKYFKKYIPKPEGKAYALLPENNSLIAKSIGVGGLPLIKENYRPEVVKSYEGMVNNLKLKDPSGRLFIITGPPGTGKTFLIRSLLNDLPEQKFIIIPSNMISSLAGPELLKTLIEASTTVGGTSKEMSIALIVEDADSCLSTRCSDNISAISSILNLSDGILGRLLDLRIICTTNAKIEDFDNAVLRRGRLGAKIEVNFLDREQAQEVYKRLEGKTEINWGKKEFYPLSDVYALAKGEETLVEEMKGPITNKSKIGFAR